MRRTPFLLALCLTACGDFGEGLRVGPSAQTTDAVGAEGQPPTATGSGGSAPETRVSIKSLTFSPKAITVKAGTTVIWMNDELTSTQHAIGQGSPSDPASAFGSNFLSPGETYPFTFNEPGEFTYYCKNHKNLPSMLNAKIIVEP